MSGAIFPLAYGSEDLRLLTALGLGFLFGLALERGGFGNARKLAAQFYGHDMAVFKVMFTAIIVAMVGLFTFVEMGWMNLDGLFINPTFLGAQLTGGFVLGVGFLLSGLCPGTAIVSAASGRWDGLVAFAGITVGALAFILLVDWVPGLYALHTSGYLGRVLLPDVLGVSPLTLTFLVAVIAGAGFVGAERVEAIFQRRFGSVELTPRADPTGKFVLSGAVAAVAVLGSGFAVGSRAAPEVSIASLEPLALAEEIIDGTPGILILDLRVADDPERRIPGSYPAVVAEEAASLLATAPRGATVVLVLEDGTEPVIPDDWPRTVNYATLVDGFEGWNARVLTPVDPGDTQESRSWTDRQNQISAFFTGAAVQQSSAPPPPPTLSGGPSGGKPRGGGC